MTFHLPLLLSHCLLASFCEIYAMLTAQLSEINGLTECKRVGSGTSQATVPMLEISMCRVMLLLGPCSPFQGDSQRTAARILVDT